MTTKISLPSRDAAIAAYAAAPARFAGYEQLLRAAATPLPAAVLDINAFTLNAYSLLERAQGTPIRVASKSVRCPELLRAVLQLPGFAGVLAFTVSEAAFLVRAGVTTDVLVAYPVLDAAQLRELFNDALLLKTITLMVDHPAQLDFMVATRQAYLREHPDSALAQLPVRLCLDIDCGLKIGPLRAGALRSAIHTPQDAQRLAQQISNLAGFQLCGVMGYEAQIAGVQDRSIALRLMKAASIKQLHKKRHQLVAAVQSVCDLEFINGGGTGSFESTLAEGVVTELAAGSGLFAPHLFDGYRSFQPLAAAFFALQVTRNPLPGTVTVSGGGWVASGQMGADRLPQPVWPEGLQLTALEGAGEVQTPLRCASAVPPVGGLTWWRHAKAGELSERVNEFWVFADDYSHTAPQAVKTYRGLGKAFL